MHDAFRGIQRLILEGQFNMLKFVSHRHRQATLVLLFVFCKNRRSQHLKFLLSVVGLARRRSHMRSTWECSVPAEHARGLNEQCVSLVFIRLERVQKRSLKSQRND